MTKITFIASDGSRKDIEARDGDSVMSTAVSHGVRGIVGDCGGAMACATCHVVVAAEWAERVGGRSSNEEDMLEFAASEMQPTSRLSCQIKVAPELDGLVLHIPDAQI